MKRAAIVLGSYLFSGLALYILSTNLPKESLIGQWCWFLGLLGMAVPGLTLFGLLIILPHEFGHVWVGKRLGFHFVGLKLLGFSWYHYARRNCWSWNFDYIGNASRTLIKDKATLKEIQLVLIAGPIASVTMGAVWSPFMFFEVTKEFGVVAVVANISYALGSLLPTAEKMNDGAILLLSKKDPKRLLKRTQIHYDQTVSWLRPSNYRWNPIKLTGDANSDCAQYMSQYIKLMDAGKLDEAGEYLKNALDIAVESDSKQPHLVDVAYEAAVYFRRFHVDEKIASAADIVCQRLDVAEKRQMVDGAKLWFDGDHKAATKIWQASVEEYFRDHPNLDIGSRVYGRDWFLRLRTADMVFETDRLFARLWRPEDIASSFEIYRNPEVVKYLGREPKPMATIEEMTGIIERRLEAQKEWKPGKGFWALVRKEDEKLIGAIMCKFLPDGENNLTSDVEIGWHLGQDFWGSGYATEAAKAVAEYGFKTDPVLNRLVAVIYDANEPSKKVARKIGMKHIGKSAAYYGVELEVFELKRT